MKITAVLLAGLALALPAAAEEPFNGLGLNLGNLYRTSDAQTRTINAENPTGAKGEAAKATTGGAHEAARELGQGWKMSPFIHVAPKTTVTLAEITGSGAIQHVWMLPWPTEKLRAFILRFYWDDETEPSVECPAGDFFASGLGRYAQISSAAVCVNPNYALNCYWVMPFHKKARITMENRDVKEMTLYYQVDYTLTRVPDDAGTFHAQFRRENPVKTPGIYTILDGVQGVGQYVGTYLAWGTHSNGWWGEGEVKFYLDGDRDFPTIAGTGAEDYFGGANDFIVKDAQGVAHFVEFTTPYSGLPQVIQSDGVNQSQQRFGLYRWHIMDPVRFQHDLKVTIQDLGWQSEHRYRKLQDDIASVAYWYQTGPHAKYPPLPSPGDLELH